MTISEIRSAIRTMIEEESGSPSKRFYDWESFDPGKLLGDSAGAD